MTGFLSAIFGFFLIAGGGVSFAEGSSALTSMTIFCTLLFSVIVALFSVGTSFFIFLGLESSSGGSDIVNDGIESGKYKSGQRYYKK